MKPRVPISVVVPTVVRPTELRRCLDALLDADALPAEVLVVDQGGAGETASVIESYQDTDLRVTHLRSHRRGLSAARNTGVQQVSTPWVAFTDDDCVPTRSWLAAVHRRASAADSPDGVTGRVLPFGEATPQTRTLSLRVSTEPAVFHGRAWPWSVGTGGNMALRVSTLRAVGGYDERLGAGSPGEAGEDLEIIHRLLRGGAALAFDPAVVICHNRVSAQRRLATRRSYGFGMGAFAGMWLRRDWWAGAALARWLLLRVDGAARAAKNMDRARWHEEALLVAGLAAGLRYGLRRSPLADPSQPVTADPAGEGVVDRGEL